MSDRVLMHETTDSDNLDGFNRNAFDNLEKLMGCDASPNSSDLTIVTVVLQNGV